jgi:hypothetical protein
MNAAQFIRQQAAEAEGLRPVLTENAHPLLRQATRVLCELRNRAPW